APVICQSFADQKCQRDARNRCQRNGKSRGGCADSENFKRSDDEPVEQRWLRQTRQAVVGWPQPLMRSQHLARTACVLTLGVIVEIAPTERGQMNERRERD